MKYTILLLTAFIFSLSAFSCEVYDTDTVLVSGDKIQLDVINRPVVKLVAQSKEEFEVLSAKITGNYAGFECEVKDVFKVTESCYEVLVSWSPGADFSGCDVEVLSNKGASYKAFLFMDYHAH